MELKFYICFTDLNEKKEETGTMDFAANIERVKEVIFFYFYLT